MLKLVYSALLGFLLAIGVMHTNVMAQDKDEKIHNFTLKDANFQEVSLKQFADQKAVVVIFTSSHCSWATKYEQRLAKLHKQFEGQKVAFLAINSNDASISQSDAVARMRQLSPFPFPYLKDQDQAVARMFKATRTPEAIVLQPQDSTFKLVYRGKIDDNPLDEASVKSSFLANAIEQLVAAKPIKVKETEVSGCNIKWLREVPLNR